MTGVLASVLLHSIWQGALIAPVAALALRLLRGASAQARYLVAGVGLAAMLCAFAITAARSINVEGGLTPSPFGLRWTGQTALTPPLSRSGWPA